MLESMDLRIFSRNFESLLSVVIVPQDFQDIVYSVHSSHSAWTSHLAEDYYNS